MFSACVNCAIACLFIDKFVSASLSEGTVSRANLNNLHNATIEQKAHRFRRDQYQTMPYKVPKNHVLLDYGWSPRQLTSFSSTNLLPSQSNSNEYPYPVSGGGGGSDDDNAVSAGGHGWGWEQHGKGCNSALGLLGILGLATYLQNVLRQMNNNNNGNNMGGMTGAGGGGAGGGMGGGFSKMRGKRSSEEPSSDQHYDSTSEILPYLLHLKPIREGTWPIHCAAYPICMLCNSMAKHYELRDQGMILMKHTVRAVASEILSPLMRTNRRHQVNEVIDRAAVAGLKRGFCEKTFKDCRNNMYISV